MKLVENYAKEGAETPGRLHIDDRDVTLLL